MHSPESAKTLSVRLAIFASGSGTNTQNLIDYFRNSDTINISLIVSNKADAGVLTIAEKEGIPTLIIEKERFFRGDGYSSELRSYQIDLIVLAGFLWIIPLVLIRAFPDKIINIHPALLPKYGGKGMYGAAVHEAVISAKEKESGISIHFVDEIYDHGRIIFQARCPVAENDSPESLAGKIHALEYAHYPRVIGELVSFQNIVKRSL